MRRLEPEIEQQRSAREGLADALNGLKHDVPRVIEMGKAARRTVDDGWTWAQQARAYGQMWRECLR